MSASDVPEDPLITIKVASPVKLAIGTMSIFKVTPESTILDLKNLILAKFPTGEPGPGPDRQRLIFRGQLLDDQKSISQVLKEGSSENAKSVHFHLAIKPLEDPFDRSRGRDFSSLFSSSNRSLFGSTSGPSSSSNSLAVSTPPASQSSPPSLSPTPIDPTRTSRETEAPATIPAPSTASAPSAQFSSSSFSAPTVPVTNPIFSSSIPSFGPTSTETATIIEQPVNTINQSIPLASSASSFSSDVEDVFTVQIPRNDTAGILDNRRFAYSVTDSGAPTVNLVGPNSIIIPIPVEQIAFVRNYSGELLCCLSPEAIDRLSRILHKQVTTEALFCRTPIFTDSPLGVPSYDPFLVPTSRNIYLSLPQPTTPVEQPQPANQEQVNNANEVNADNNDNNQAEPPRNGFRIRIGQRNLDLNFQLLRDNQHILTLLFRLFVFVDVFAMNLQSTLQFWVVTCAATIVAFWHSNMTPQIGHHIVERFRQLLGHLPHRHPEVPPEDPPAPPAQDNEEGQAENANNNIEAAHPLNRQEEEPQSQLRQVLWAIQGVIFMFIGSLVPFVYDRWAREDRRRREHAEQRQRALIAQQAEAEQQLLEQQREEQEQQEHQEGQEQNEGQEVKEKQDLQQEPAQEQGRSNDLAGKHVTEALGEEEPESVSPIVGPSGSSQYTGTDQTLLHRNT